jgi:hypothetical protein
MLTVYVLFQGKILGVESPYGAVCRSFNKLAFQDEDAEHSLTLQENDMIEVRIPFKDFLFSNSHSQRRINDNFCSIFNRLLVHQTIHRQTILSKHTWSIEVRVEIG